MILALVDEAVAAGARLRAACEIIGLSVRAVERWRMRPEGDDRRCGPLHAPGNALSESEKAQVLAVMTTSGLSPKQLVPQLADKGVYLASESTLYRLQRRYGLRRAGRALRPAAVDRP